MRIIKRLLLVLVVLLVVVVAAAFIVPVAFKDDIQTAIDEAIAENVVADVHFDTDNLSLSLLRNFPNLSVGLSDFSVINVAPFEGDTLVALDELTIVLDLGSVLFGDAIGIKKVELDHPTMYILTLEDGTANYLITKETDEEEEPDAEGDEGDPLRIAIEEWKITDGNIYYLDQSLAIAAHLEGVQHTGSGDITTDVFDINTFTYAEEATIIYDGVEYVTKNILQADLAMNIDLANERYTFLDNEYRINEFVFAMDGFVGFVGDDLEMDLSFDQRENSFKSLLSLVPGMYTEDFTGLMADGSLTFGGMVKGVMSDSLGTMPSFAFDLGVTDGRFQYPDLPSAVEDVQVDLAIDNATGVVEDTRVELRQFHLKMGNNPVDMTLLVNNLRDFAMEAKVDARLDLNELTKLFPIEGLDLKGTFALAAEAEGIYDSVKNIMPSVRATMRLTDGYVKNQELPTPLEALNFVASVDVPDGAMEKGQFVLESFAMSLADQQFSATAQVNNFVNYAWQAAAKGSVELEKLMALFPQEGMEVKGLLTADLSTGGNMAALEAEQWDQLPTSGSLALRGFYYADQEALPQGVALSTADFSFNPQQAQLSSVNGTLGASDFALSGSVSNYLAYVMDGSLLKGNMRLTGKKLDLNEWMTEEEPETEEKEETEEEPLEVVQLPENIDFTFASAIDKVLYDDLELQQFQGTITVRDGVLSMKQVGFHTLGGSMTLNGDYDPRNADAPRVAMDLALDQLDIAQTFLAFSSLQQLVPIAEDMTGTFSTDFNVNGLLDNEMMPNLATWSGAGLINIVEAALSGNKVVNGINSLSNLGMGSGTSGEKTVGLKDVLLQAQIKDGRIHFQPFDFTVGDMPATVSGSGGIDGSLDYRMEVTVPSGQLGQAANAALSSLGLGSNNISEEMILPVKVGGTYDKPSYELGTPRPAGTSAESEQTSTVQAAVQQQTQQVVDDTRQQAEAEAQRARQEAERQARQEAERLRREAEEKAKREAEEAAKKLRGLF